MNVILTNLDKPLVIESINRGNIVVDELKVWPGWKEYSGVVATYQWKSQPNVVRKIKIENDKVITFQDISEAFNTELNKSSADITIARLSHENGRVSLYLKPDTQLTNVKIADDIARELKIKPDKPNIGEPVDIGKIAFYNVDNIFMTCDQAKSRTFIDSREAETVLASTSFDSEIEVTSFEASNPTLFYAPVGQLSFSIQNRLGTKLPVERLFCRLTINDEREQRNSTHRYLQQHRLTTNPTGSRKSMN